MLYVSVRFLRRFFLPLSSSPVVVFLAACFFSGVAFTVLDAGAVLVLVVLPPFDAGFAVEAGLAVDAG
jgi:hypothetical protein